MITAFLAIGLPKLKFDSGVKSMLPANNPAMMIRDYYANDGNFASYLSYFIGVESDNAFSVESLKYLRVITAEIDKANQSLPVDNVAKYMGLSKNDARLIVEAARGQGINDQTIASSFLPTIRDASKSAQSFSWDAATASRIAAASTGVDPFKFFHFVENPIKKTQSLVNADYIVNKDDELVSDKLLPSDVAITSEVARGVKERAASWNVYENVLYAKDGTLANLVVESSSTEQEVTESIAASLKAILSSHQAPGMTTYLDGESVISLTTGQTMKSDLVTLLPLIVLIVVLVLFLCFRNIQAVVYPMIVVLVSVVASMGAMGWLGAPLTVASVILPTLMVAIASAYGIHQMNHYLLDPSKDKREILERNIGVVGLAIVLSGVTVIIGFGALAVEQFVPIRNFGIFTALGDLVAVAVALWTLPALILVSHRPKPSYRESDRGAISRVLRGLVSLNKRHSKAVIFGSAAVTLLMGLGMFSVKSELNNVSFFKENTAIHKADDKLNQKLAGTQDVAVYLDSDLKAPIVGKDGKLEAASSTESPVVLTTPVVLSRIDAFSAAVIKKFPYVHKVMSFDDILKKMNQEMNDGNSAYFTIPADANLISQYLLIFSGDIQSYLSPNHDKLRIDIMMERIGTREAEAVAQYAREYFAGDFAKDNHLRVEVSGVAHLYYVANELLVDGMIKSIVVCVVLVLVILLLLLKESRMALISMSPIFAALIINFGTLGLFNIPLNIATAMVSSIVVGIGVDYSIHFITWYRSELRKERNIALALENTILHKGRAILENMILIVAGFLVLTLSNFIPLVQFGLLVAICMLTTAFGALAVVPAIIRSLAKNDRDFLYLER
jgi:hypothetical protein